MYIFIYQSNSLTLLTPAQALTPSCPPLPNQHVICPEGRKSPGTMVIQEEGGTCGLSQEEPSLECPETKKAQVRRG